jgi:PPOX class probable F420-dependent enzyme
MISDSVRAFLAESPLAVLGTLRADGGIHQSVVYYAIDGDRLLISTEGNRTKAHNVLREQRASLCVVGTSPPHPAVTIEGPARVRTTGIAEDTTAVFARITGTEEPLKEEDLKAGNRVIIEITVDHVYGISHFETRT